MNEFSLMEETLPEDPKENQTAESENQSENAGDITVPIKFNKEIRNIKLEEAGMLAQKGLKFDSISADYEALKRIAAGNGKSVTAFLSELEKTQAESRKKELTKQCGGNEEMAAYVLNLEKVPGDIMGFEEVTRAFPNIRSVEDLPEEVVERAQLKGRLLLDEYLRYRHENRKAARDSQTEQKNADFSSIGSQMNRGGGIEPEAEQFLKGIWK